MRGDVLEFDEAPSLTKVSKKQIGIIDVGVGNIYAVENSLLRLGYTPKRVKEAKEIASVAGLILPGVGNMREFMYRLKGRGLAREIQSAAGSLNILGICLGYQALFQHSLEGDVSCLGLIEGMVEPIENESGLETRIGMYRVVRTKESIWKQDKEIRGYYFAHSYYVKSGKFTTHEVLSGQLYQAVISATVEKGNIFGVQFHPELSRGRGRLLIDTFGRKCMYS